VRRERRGRGLWRAVRFVVGAVEDMCFFAVAGGGASEVRCKGAGTALVVSVGYLFRRGFDYLPPLKVVVCGMHYQTGVSFPCL